MARGQVSNVGGLVVVLLFVFLLVVYLLVAVPTIDGVSDQLDKSKIQDAGYMDQYNFVLDVGMLFVPTLLGMGIIAYLYAQVSGKGAFRGGGPR